MKKIVISGILFFIFLASCTSFHQNISIAPTASEYPISASYYVVGAGGKTFSQDDLKIVHEFSFTKRYTVSIHEKNYNLRLEEDLNKIINENNGKGIIGLTVSFKKIDATVLGLISLERTASVCSLLLGVPLVYGAG